MFKMFVIFEKLGAYKSPRFRQISKFTKFLQKDFLGISKFEDYRDFRKCKIQYSSPLGYVLQNTRCPHPRNIIDLTARILVPLVQRSKLPGPTFVAHPPNAPIRVTSLYGRMKFPREFETGILALLPAPEHI